ncbi:DNA-formamidopyrimidine glycosylase family protein [Listeria floridensis]|uniref:DNA-formamidopyrimidine glycosylase family protein n=1 Tax=Listeria floridensis TaxID=1494962 RepID=UPI0004AF431A|nr:DNA-formamidopyrimidine glycosylase family protein [Listeria floridensis]
MIELPESQVIAKQMKILEGKEISNVITQFSPHKFAFFTEANEPYSEKLVGKKIQSIRSYGGFIEWDFGEYQFTFSEGVTFYLLQPHDATPKKHQILISFTDGSALAATVRMYGMFFLFKKNGIC